MTKGTRKTREQIDRIFYPRSVAVVGANRVLSKLLCSLTEADITRKYPKMSRPCQVYIQIFEH